MESRVDGKAYLLPYKKPSELDLFHFLNTVFNSSLISNRKKRKIKKAKNFFLLKTTGYLNIALHFSAL